MTDTTNTTDDLPPTCAACESDLDHGGRDRGASTAYPYCSECHYGGRAGDHAHADVLAACAARDLLAAVEQTGGGCMNLRIYREHGSATPWSTAGVDPSDVAAVLDATLGGFFVPSVVAVGALRDDAGAWFADDASLPDAGAPWCAWFVSTVEEENGDGETWNRPTLPLDADALAAHADSILPPARSHVVRVSGVDTYAVTAADALDALQAATAVHDGEPVTLATR